MSTIASFENTENKFDVYWGKDSMKKFSKFLREYALEIINLKKKKWSYSHKSRRNHTKMHNTLIFVKKYSR